MAAKNEQNDALRGRTLVGRAVKLGPTYMVDFQLDLRDRRNRLPNRPHPHLYEGKTMRQENMWVPTHWVQVDRPEFQRMMSLAGENSRRQGEYFGDSCIEFAMKADLVPMRNPADGFTVDTQSIQRSSYDMYRGVMERQDSMERMCRVYGSCAMERTAEAVQQRSVVVKPSIPTGLREVEQSSNEGVSVDRLYG